MYEQLDIFGNWIPVDENGVVHGSMKYKLELKTSHSLFVDTQSFETEAQLNKFIAACVQIIEREHKEKVKEVKISKRSAYVSDEYEFIFVRTLKRLKKYREMKI